MRQSKVLLVALLAALVVSPVAAQEANLSECEAQIQELEDQMIQEMESANSSEERQSIEEEYRQRIESLEQECYTETTESQETVGEEPRQEELPEDYRNITRERPDRYEPGQREVGETSLDVSLPPAVPEKCRKKVQELSGEYESRLDNKTDEEQRKIMQEFDSEMERILDECAGSARAPENISELRESGEFEPPAEIPDNFSRSKVPERVRSKICKPAREKLEKKNEKIKQLQERIEELESRLSEDESGDVSRDSSSESAENVAPDGETEAPEREPGTPESADRRDQDAGGQQQAPEEEPAPEQRRNPQQGEQEAPGNESGGLISGIVGSVFG